MAQFFEQSESFGCDHTDSLAFINGREALEQANYNLAINNFTILIERHPSQAQYLFMRAKAFLGLSAFDLCQKDLEKALKLGMVHPEVHDLLAHATSEREKRGTNEDFRPDFLALVALRRNYRLRSLILSVDEALAEANYNLALKLLDLAERLVDHKELSSDLGFSLGKLRAQACIGNHAKLDALKVIDFHLNHAYSVGRDDQVRLFKMLRSQAYS
ncbi:hypothetical protein BH11CYA1_BH11CYA1_37110 [soil metagenome]